MIPNCLDLSFQTLDREVIALLMYYHLCPCSTNLVIFVNLGYDSIDVLLVRFTYQVIVHFGTAAYIEFNNEQY